MLWNLLGWISGIKYLYHICNSKLAMHNGTSVTLLLFHSEAYISLSLFLKKQFQQVLNRLFLSSQNFYNTTCSVCLPRPITLKLIVVGISFSLYVKVASVKIIEKY